MSALPRHTVAYLQPRPPSHAVVLDLIRHGNEINLEDMANYLGALLDKKASSSHPQWVSVAQALEKVMESIDECLAEEQAELPKEIA